MLAIVLTNEQVLHEQQKAREEKFQKDWVEWKTHQPTESRKELLKIIPRKEK